jgi:hypothetical protein
VWAAGCVFAELLGARGASAVLWRPVAAATARDQMKQPERHQPSAMYCMSGAR